VVYWIFRIVTPSSHAFGMHFQGRNNRAIHIRYIGLGVRIRIETSYTTYTHYTSQEADILYKLKQNSLHSFLLLHKIK